MSTITDCAYWKYLGENDVPKVEGSIKHIDPSQLDEGVVPLTEEEYESGSKSTPKVLTRSQKGQALTHLEMDFNLASLFHKLNTSSVSSSFSEDEYSEDNDVYFERRKPTREEEKAGLFATFSYAPITNDRRTLIQNGFQTIKVQHTTDEIRYKLSNERIPGTLDIEEDFRVTGSAFVGNNLYVTGNLDVQNDTSTRTLNVEQSASIEQTLRVKGTASFDRDLTVEGNLYVKGLIFGDLSQKGYNSLENPGYAAKYTRFGTQDTGSQSDFRLKKDCREIENALEAVEHISGYRFEWDSKAEKSGSDIGVIAQEVKPYVPEAVSTGEDGYLRVDYVKLIPILINAIHELRCQVTELQQKQK